MPTPTPVTATVSPHPFHAARIVVPADDDSDGPSTLLTIGDEPLTLLSERQITALLRALLQHKLDRHHAAVVEAGQASGSAA